MMKAPSLFRYRKFMERLQHLQARRQGLPDELLDWTHDYFGKSPNIQKSLKVHLDDAPEVAAANLIKLEYARLGLKGMPRKVRK